MHLGVWYVVVSVQLAPAAHYLFKSPMGCRGITLRRLKSSTELPADSENRRKEARKGGMCCNPQNLGNGGRSGVQDHLWLQDTLPLKHVFR